MASSNQTGTVGQKATAESVQRAAAANAIQISDRRDRRDQAAQAEVDQAVQAEVARLRMKAAATAARSVKRKALAVRALEAKRAATLARAHSWLLPIKEAVKTSNFGPRWGRLHAGEDFAAPVGTDLVSMSTGRVVFSGQQSGFGNLIQIRYWDGTISYYAHMSRLSANVGERVAPGQVVGQSGNTGHSTGPHLHLEIHPGGGAPVNPLPWLEDHDL